MTAQAVPHEKLSFVQKWLFSTNHKNIGVLYLWFTCLAGVVAVAFSMIMRAELLEPGVQVLRTASGAPDGQLYNVLVSAHGTLMMFFVIIPAMFGGFGNYLCRS